MIDPIDELVARSSDDPELRAFHKLHKAHPQVLDFLVSEIRLRIEKGFGAFSLASLWHYARWKMDMTLGPGETYLLNDHAAPYYGRAILILHPEFNGRCEFRKANADAVFGLTHAPGRKKKGDYAGRLVWADGTPLESGWRPSEPHVLRHGGSLRPHIHPR